MRRATSGAYAAGLTAEISIHALHEESDVKHVFIGIVVQISIHALHEESDFHLPVAWSLTFLFQSTLSMRRATVRLGLGGRRV